MKPDFKILSPTAILGYGFPESSFLRGMAEKPDLIAVDGGSTDPGPFYLGAGKSFTDRTAVKRDLKYMIVHGVKAGIPVVVGTCGGSGAAPHLEWCKKIVLEIAQEEKLSFNLATIPTDIDKDIIHIALDKGEIEPLDSRETLTHEIIDACTYVVAQAGVEPFIRAFEAGANVILAGRTYDPACFAALPIMKGYDAGLALHCGKILECAAIAATPGSGSDCVMGIIKEDCFILKALSDDRKFTAESAAAHTLYEKSDPYFLPGPGGVLDLTECAFKELGDGTVSVSGSKHIHRPYQVKLEGARCLGYRTISIAGIRDPIMIAGIDDIIKAVKERVQVILGEDKSSQVFFHIYGKNGVMGSLEPLKDTHPHELGIVIEVVANSQEKADTLCSLTRSTLLHYGYPKRVATAGNLAFPFSPSDTSAGPVYGFALYHLMPVNEKTMFPFHLEKIRY